MLIMIGAIKKLILGILGFEFLDVALWCLIGRFRKD